MSLGLDLVERKLSQMWPILSNESHPPNVLPSEELRELQVPLTGGFLRRDFGSRLSLGPSGCIRQQLPEGAGEHAVLTLLNRALILVLCNKFSFYSVNNVTLFVHV